MVSHHACCSPTPREQTGPDWTLAIVTPYKPPAEISIVQRSKEREVDQKVDDSIYRVYLWCPKFAWEERGTCWSDMIWLEPVGEVKTYTFEASGFVLGPDYEDRHGHATEWF